MCACVIFWFYRIKVYVLVIENYIIISLHSAGVKCIDPVRL